MNDRYAKPRLLDLCSGTGSFSIAFEREGFETIGFSEIDPFCCRLLKERWPNVRNFGDLRSIPAPRCNVITAGDPCQPFSQAGRKLGEADDRYLWPAVLATVQRCKPDFFLGENVTAIANMVLSRRIDDLEACGYQSQAFDIPSCALGLPTMERHIWLVAARTEVGLQAASKSGIPGKRVAEGGQTWDSFEWWQASDGAPIIEGRRHIPEPYMLRSSKGIANWMDRVAAIGNAAPMPIIQVFARAIYQQLTCSTPP